MSSISRRKGIIILFFGLILAVTGCSSQSSKTSVDPDTGKHYIAGWSNPDSHGAWAMQSSSEGGLESCRECHGDDFSGGISKTACATCHGGSAPHPQTWTSGTRKHSGADQSNAGVCAVCHTNGANSPMQPPPTPAPAGTAPGCFNNTLCHDQNMGHAPGWADPDAHGASTKSQANGFSGCKTCHGSDFSGSTTGTAPSCLESGLCHGPTTTSPHPQAPWRTSGGSARTHTNTNSGNSAVCAECHALGANLVTVPVPTNLVGGTPDCFNNTLCHGQVGHAAGWATPDQHGAAAKSVPNASNMTGFSTCQTCHGVNFGGGTAQTCLNTTCHGAASPHVSPWKPSSTYKHSATDEGNARECALCHLASRNPPSYVALGGTTVQGCNDGKICHPVGGFTCVTCHETPQDSPVARGIDATVTQRRAIVPEFQQAWSHKPGGTVTNADCAVCHMEGNVTDGATTPLHRNGTIELRDPDTGNTIEGVTFGGTGAGSYTSTGSPRSFVRFSRDLSAAFEADSSFGTLAAIQINQCLKCHDSDASAGAGKGGSSTIWAPGGSSTNPFASGVAPADVNAHFNTANASYHPIRGRQNNSYADIDTMVAPYNQASKTPATTTQWGDLISCFDCHAASGASGTQASTVVAHGGAVTLRALYNADIDTPTNLCVVCHTQAVYWGSGTSMYTHVPGLSVSALATVSSGWTSGGRHDADQNTEFRGCTVCHGTTTYQGALPAQNILAENAHGFNTAYGTSTTWPSGASAWAFLRFGNNRASLTTGWDNSPGTCAGTMCAETGRNDTYTPGGAY